MIEKTTFEYKPLEYETEKASNSYLMSLVALIVGLPLPIINFIATIMFYFGNRKSTYFVRWHCLQNFYTQLSLFLLNSSAWWWTLYIIFGKGSFSNLYFGYIFTILIFNLIEFIATIYSAIYVRKGIHVKWWFFGSFTDQFCKK
jgi:uncharacterized membrane protein